MRQRRALIISAAALSAILAGCGSGTVQPPAALPTGAGTQGGAAGTAAAAVPTATASLPADLTVDFQEPATADQTQAALVAYARQLLYAYEQALARGKPTDALAQSLVTGQADVQLTQLLGQSAGKGTRPSGTVTFFRVTPSIAGGFEGVGLCENDSQAVPVSVTTGARKGGAPTGGSALRQWNMGFAKDGSGKLRINYLTTQLGSSACG